jgi:hypothetical protein
MGDVREEGAEPPIRVVRDSTFVRFVADRLSVTEQGRDLEIACLQSGPLHTRIIDHGEFEEFESEPVATEVARMRLSYSTMVQLVMSFLRGGIQNDRIKGPAIVNQLNQWIEEYRNTDD